MKIIPRIGFVFLASALLAGCTMPLANGIDQLPEVNNRFPIRVEPRVASLVVAVPTSGELQIADVERVKAFADTWKSRGYGSIGVSAEGSPAADRAAYAVRDILAGAQVGPDALRFSARRDGAGSGPSSVVLSFMTDSAVAESCDGLWDENIGEAPRNMPWPDFACASQRNLAALIEDPRDLLRPRHEDPADAMRRGIVLDKYRKGEPTASQKDQSQEGGLVSDVAKE